MARTPHDIPDLYLAPVVLAVDARLAELCLLDAKELAVRVTMEANLPDHTLVFREAALLATVGYLIDTHGWSLTWDARGIRLARGLHSVVLGVPPTFRQYVDEGYGRLCRNSASLAGSARAGS
jgi:hypothetical protein